jgi:hypothetical protein
VHGVCDFGSCRRGPACPLRLLPRSRLLEGGGSPRHAQAQHQLSEQQRPVLRGQSLGAGGGRWRTRGAGGWQRAGARPAPSRRGAPPPPRPPGPRAWAPNPSPRPLPGQPRCAHLDEYVVMLVGRRIALAAPRPSRQEDRRNGAQQLRRGRWGGLGGDGRFRAARAVLYRGSHCGSRTHLHIPTCPPSCCCPLVGGPHPRTCRSSGSAGRRCSKPGGPHASHAASHRCARMPRT